MNQADFKFVQDLVRQEAAIVINDHKLYLVECRVGALARQEGFECVQTMIARVRSGARRDLRASIVDAMTTNETSFFRDDVPWQALRETVLPTLVDRRRKQRRLSIWSAACSTGQEPYTVAMMLDAHFPELAGWNVQILATDISQTVLDKAQGGTYQGLEMTRGLDSSLQHRYFSEVGGSKWQLCQAIRDKVDFRQLNLTRPFQSISRFDLVLLRNVLIYFDVSTKRDILSRVQRQMAPDGLLLLGSGESTINLGLRLARKRHRQAWFYENG